MKINPLTAVKYTKLAVTFVVGAGAGKIVREVIKNNVNEPENAYDRVTKLAGAWAIGGVVASASKKYTDEVIDGLVDSVVKFDARSKVRQKANRVTAGTSTFEAEGLVEADFTKVDGKWTPTEDSEGEYLAMKRKPATVIETEPLAPVN